MINLLELRNAPVRARTVRPWALAERTRWSGLVVAVGGLTVAVMTARLVMLARGTGV